MKISQNELVTLLLCSDIALSDKEKPLSNLAYDLFARALYKEGKQPSDLFSLSESEIFAIYQNNQSTIFKKCRTKDFHERIPLLLKRHQQLIMQLSEYENAGIKVLTRADKAIYPKILRSKLYGAGIPIPPVIYYAGNLCLLDSDKIISIVGSRNLENDIDAKNFTKIFVKKAIEDDYIISSGGAKGIDDFALNTAIEENGKFIITVSDSLEKKIKEPKIRKALMSNNALYMSLANPLARFAGYNAMERNKIIYAIAKYSMVVSCDYKLKEKNGKSIIDKNKGGTWVGANECFENNLSKLLVRSNKELTPKGNKALLEMVNAIEIENDCIYNKNIFSKILEDAERASLSKPPVISSKEVAKDNHQSIQTDLFGNEIESKLI
ncbi:MAG: DNA-processing protein DprA [Succinivibrionaceae bacterium]